MCLKWIGQLCSHCRHIKRSQIFSTFQLQNLGTMKSQSKDRLRREFYLKSYWCTTLFYIHCVGLVLDGSTFLVQPRHLWPQQERLELFLHHNWAVCSHCSQNCPTVLHFWFSQLFLSLLRALVFAVGNQYRIFVEG